MREMRLQTYLLLVAGAFSNGLRFKLWIHHFLYHSALSRRFSCLILTPSNIASGGFYFQFKRFVPVLPHDYAFRNVCFRYSYKK